MAYFGGGQPPGDPPVLRNGLPHPMFPGGRVFPGPPPPHMFPPQNGGPDGGYGPAGYPGHFEPRGPGPMFYGEQQHYDQPDMYGGMPLQQQMGPPGMADPHGHPPFQGHAGPVEPTKILRRPFDGPPPMQNNNEVYDPNFPTSTNQGQNFNHHPVNQEHHFASGPPVVLQQPAPTPVPPPPPIITPGHTFNFSAESAPVTESTPTSSHSWSLPTMNTNTDSKLPQTGQGQQQSESGKGESTVRVMTGLVTQIQPGGFGMISEEIFFQQSAVTGSMPEVGDKVVVEAEPVSGMPFKYNAKRVTKLDVDLVHEEKFKNSPRPSDNKTFGSLPPLPESLNLPKPTPAPQLKSILKRNPPPPPIISKTGSQAVVDNIRPSTSLQSSYKPTTHELNIREKDESRMFQSSKQSPPFEFELSEYTYVKENMSRRLSPDTARVLPNPSRLRDIDIEDIIERFELSQKERLLAQNRERDSPSMDKDSSRKSRKSKEDVRHRSRSKSKSPVRKRSDRSRSRSLEKRSRRLSPSPQRRRSRSLTPRRRRESPQSKKASSSKHHRTSRSPSLTRRRRISRSGSRTPRRNRSPRSLSRERRRSLTPRRIRSPPSPPRGRRRSRSVSPRKNRLSRSRSRDRRRSRSASPRRRRVSGSPSRERLRSTSPGKRRSRRHSPDLHREREVSRSSSRSRTHRRSDREEQGRKRPRNSSSSSVQSLSPPRHSPERLSRGVGGFRYDVSNDRGNEDLSSKSVPAKRIPVPVKFQIAQPAKPPQVSSLPNPVFIPTNALKNVALSTITKTISNPIATQHQGQNADSRDKKKKPKEQEPAFRIVPKEQERVVVVRKVPIEQERVVRIVPKGPEPAFRTAPKEEQSKQKVSEEVSKSQSPEKQTRFPKIEEKIKEWERERERVKSQQSSSKEESVKSVNNNGMKKNDKSSEDIFVETPLNILQIKLTVQKDLQELRAKGQSNVGKNLLKDQINIEALKQTVQRDLRSLKDPSLKVQDNTEVEKRNESESRTVKVNPPILDISSIKDTVQKGLNELRSKFENKNTSESKSKDVVTPSQTRSSANNHNSRKDGDEPKAAEPAKLKGGSSADNSKGEVRPGNSEKSRRENADPLPTKKPPSPKPRGRSPSRRRGSGATSSAYFGQGFMDEQMERMKDEIHFQRLLEEEQRFRAMGDEQGFRQLQYMEDRRRRRLEERRLTRIRKLEFKLKKEKDFAQLKLLAERYGPPEPRYDEERVLRERRLQEDQDELNMRPEQLEAIKRHEIEYEKWLQEEASARLREMEKANRGCEGLVKRRRTPSPGSNASGPSRRRRRSRSASYDQYRQDWRRRHPRERSPEMDYETFVQRYWKLPPNQFPPTAEEMMPQFPPAFQPYPPCDPLEQDRYIIARAIDDVSRREDEIMMREMEIQQRLAVAESRFPGHGPGHFGGPGGGGPPGPHLRGRDDSREPPKRLYRRR